MKYIIFLDIDGTLVGFDGKMSEKTKYALKKAKENLHKIVLCTGRNKCEIYPWLFDCKFNGIISSSGASVEYDEKVIYQHVVEKEKLEKLIELFKKEEFAYILQCSNGIYTDEVSYAHILESLRKMGIKDSKVFEQTIGSIHICNNPESRLDVEKMIYIDAPITVTEFRKRIDPYFTLVESSVEKPNPYSGEITCTGIDKSSGMEHLLDYLNLDRKQSVAIGDGPNDLEMIQYAGIGVVMGNAKDGLKKYADMVTDSVTEDGVYHAFERLGII